MEIQSMEASASVLFTTAADRLNHVAMQMQQNEIPPMLQVDQIAALASAAAARQIMYAADEVGRQGLNLLG